MTPPQHRTSCQHLGHGLTLTSSFWLGDPLSMNADRIFFLIPHVQFSPGNNKTALCVRIQQGLATTQNSGGGDYLM